MGIKVSFTNKGVSMFVAGTMEQYLSKALLLFNPRGTKRTTILILKSALILLLTFIPKRDILIQNRYLTSPTGNWSLKA